METTSSKTSIEKGINNFIIDNCNLFSIISSKNNEIEKSINIKQNSPSKDENLIYVVNWFDHSSKYGIGYKLNNGAYGVFFNDSTKIILGQNGEEFCYFVKNNNNYYHINNYPKDNKDLNKKVILLNHYKKYFEKQNKNKINNIKKSENKPYIYVKKWMRTKSAIIFRLINKITQFIFNDKTEIIFVLSEKSVYFKNHKGEKLKYLLRTALDSSNKEMVKRLTYAKDILKFMLEKYKVKNKDKPHIEEKDG